MRKLFVLLLSIVSLLSVSCSKDDDTVTNPQNPESFILPKKIVEDNGRGSISTTILTYNGNKILQYTEDDQKTIYTYTGDLITKIESYDGATLTYQSIYSYLNNKLATETNTETSINSTTGVTTVYKNKTVYTYNTDGTVLVENYKIDNTTGLETKNNRSSVNTYANGNLVKTVSTSTNISTYTDGNGNLVTDTYVNKTTETFEYDTKNGLAKNVLGFDKLLSPASSINNAIKTTYLSESTTNGVANPTLPATVRDYIFKYNPNGYPTEEKSDYTFYNNNVAVIKTRTTQYFYE
jgi:hypothetical protein